MDSGQIVYILTTVIAIVGAGAVALAVDLLKTSNERLRESNVELRVRREEEQRRADVAQEQLKHVQVAAAHALAAAEAQRLSAADNKLLVVRMSDTAPARTALPPVAARPSEKDWDHLLRQPALRGTHATVDVSAVPAARQRGELIPFESLQAGQETFTIPAGFHPYAALARLLDMRCPVHGLVLSIAAGAELEPATADAVETYVCEMLESGEFAAPAGGGRFVLVSPRTDTEAEQRFAAITALLARPGKAGTALYCGGTEAAGETLGDAVRAASHRMEAHRAGGPPVLGTGGIKEPALAGRAAVPSA